MDQTYLAVIAVNENWVGRLVQSNVQDLMHNLLWDCNFLRTLHINDKVLNAMGLEEWFELWWILLVDESAI